MNSTKKDALVLRPLILLLIALITMGRPVPVQAIANCKSVFDTRTTRKELRLAASRLGDTEELIAVEVAFRSLPKLGSLEWMLIVEQIRKEMSVESGRGFVLIDLRHWLPEIVFKNLYEQFKYAAQFNLLPESWDQRIGQVLFSNWPNAWGQQTVILDSRVTQAFKLLNDWIQMTVETALPNEETQANMSDIRISTSKGGVSAEYWHPDGNYLTATLLLVGEHGTQFRVKGIKGIIEAPNGVLAIVSGEKRRRNFKRVIPTVHRSPPGSTQTERMIMIWRVGN